MMFENASLKRKSSELEPGEVENESDEPEAKHLCVEIDVEASNLESTSQNNPDTNKEPGLETVTEKLKSETLIKEKSETIVVEEILQKQETVNEESEILHKETESETLIQESKSETIIVEETVPSPCKNNEEPKTEIFLEEKSETIAVEETVLSPCISITFHNDVTAGLYKTTFLNFISTFPELQVRVENDLVFDVYRDESIASSEVHSGTDTTSKKRKKHSKVKKELFVVDVKPSPNANGTHLRYTTKFVINTEEAAEDNTKPTKTLSCFNCGEGHNLKDCPHPRDSAKINAAKQKIKFTTSGRYHADEGQKYDHLAPGKISNELRRALGLYRDEAPHYIYLMRSMGYPPGWLEEAKIEHSNLDMFDIDGKNVKSKGKKHGLDESKIIEYPGFNVPFENGIVDDYHKYGVAPYSDAFNKKAMIDVFNKLYVRQEDNLEICDMDLDHSFEEDPKIMSQPERNSPSLIDLEQQKKQLLEELNDEPKNAEKSALDKEFLAVKESSFGTPILKSGSPYSTLPDPDKFSKDVSPVINFENLPNSTGKYEQLSDVLQKVRDTLKKKRDT
ncbi:zinc finger CCHC domain-containing protein 8 homolog [Tribolium madens]|uniref:zinc finger CCHC domain-containing protein 8 homolog n=1 Tax=Tribolium madens TaxID=41895 RepID=UPI001CF731E7|nr:zinc finger CCHC domain-containing protein 8 homolog [Tribolium madens]